MSRTASQSIADALLESVGATVHRWPSPHTVLRYQQSSLGRLNVDCGVAVRRIVVGLAESRPAAPAWGSVALCSAA